MKNCTFILSALLLFLGACSKENNAPAPAQSTNTYTSPGGGRAPQMRFSGDNYSQAISIEQANQMIQSYLTSINYPNQDEDIRSFVFDADTLRSYLNDTSKGRIVTLKFMLAHQPSYSQKYFGVPSGMKPDAMTLIVVGMDEDDKYIYNRANQVYDHFRPCPNTCDNAGPLLTQNM